jgi:hypothetical protein
MSAVRLVVAAPKLSGSSTPGVALDRAVVEDGAADGDVVTGSSDRTTTTMADAPRMVAATAPKRILREGSICGRLLPEFVLFRTFTSSLT